MKTAVELDYHALAEAENVDLVAFLHTLDDAQWDAASLCDGWKVRHVMSHMTLGYTTSLPSIALMVARHGFSVPKASKAMSIQYGDTHSSAEILSALEGGIANPKGLGKLIPDHEILTDHAIHQWDARVPLGLPRELPRERAVAILDALPRIGGFMQSKKRVAGLTLVATDVGHSVGDGPAVEGPAQSLILAASGRPIGLDGLSGDGLATLADRVHH